MSGRDLVKRILLAAGAGFGPFQITGEFIDEGGRRLLTWDGAIDGHLMQTALTIVDGPDGKVREEILAARARGVIFDIGHGGGSFGFGTTRGMLAAGFLPDVISSDVHVISIEGPAFDSAAGAANLIRDFHARHREIFSFADDHDEVEIVSWRAVARSRIADSRAGLRLATVPTAAGERMRSMVFRDTGRGDAPVYDLDALPQDHPVTGPAIIESNFTTIIVDPGSRAVRQATQLVVEPFVGRHVGQGG